MINKIFNSLNYDQLGIGVNKFLKNDKNKFLIINKLSASAIKSLIVAYLIKSGRFILIVKDDETNEEIYNSLKKLIQDYQIIQFKDSAGNLDEVKLYRKLIDNKYDLLIINVACLYQSVKSKKDWGFSSNLIKQGHLIKYNNFVSSLEKLGYQRQEKTIIEGDYSMRGGIIDVYSPIYQNPLRIELDGSAVKQIYYYNPINHNKINNIKSVKITPLNYQGNKILFKILEKNKANLIIDQIQELEEIIKNNYIVSGIRLNLINNKYIKIILFDSLYTGHIDGAIINCPIKEIENEQKYPKLWNNKVNQYLSEGYQVFLGGSLKLLNKLNNAVKNIPENSLHQNFIYPKANIIYYHSLDLLETQKSEIGTIKRLIKSLKKNDLVVHIDHGIGRFLKIGFYKINKINNKYIFIEYANRDMLYVPIDQAGRIKRYGLSSKKVAKLDNLRTGNWQKVIKKTKENIFKLAKILLKTAALRQNVKIEPINYDIVWQEMIKDTFNYIETSDQENAIRDVLNDLAKTKPMDRIITGDAGNGKTEVAIRAAVAVLSAHKQVALICPTTILAEQHYRVFQERIKNLPIKVCRLSRFVSKDNEKLAVKKLKNGEIDLVIGTHRLFQKDIGFQNLGLVIIDEEQKFGVEHKERIKRMRYDTHILTLTATPIPRTLYYSMLGLRDISSINTSPIGRRNVIDLIASRDDYSKIQKLIAQEIKRGGQIFFVHNRIKSIWHWQKILSESFPNINICVVHGQMDEEIISETMGDFAVGKIKILIATSIIENGLDLANVNTIIIDQAEKFGLSDLYQIRGRVGRNNQQAYACFLLSKHLTANAKKRMMVLSDEDKMISGMDIALRDLEIRGGGNILGREQHGQMERIGVNLYFELLNQVTEKLKHEDLSTLR